MRYIGDVHGKWTKYKKIISDCSDSIQVGDMGVGFRNRQTGEFYSNPPYDAMNKGNHRFIRGNHDNPGVCKGHRLWIPDGHVENDTMFIGGALSIDRGYREEGFDWWPTEELQHAEFLELQEKYLDLKPSVMVTHECPESIAKTVFSFMKISFPSITRQAFDGMFQFHKPKVWIFGHWHHSVDSIILGTRFICLNELEYIDL